MVAKDILCSILDANVRQSEEGVMYLAIKNISILFEEQLSLNVEMLFRSYSRVNLLFVVGTSNVKGHRFFPFDGCSEVFVDLSEMPYSVIYRK